MAEKAVLGELMSHSMEVERQSSGVLELLRALQARAGGAVTSAAVVQPGVTWATTGWGPLSARPFAGPPPHEQKPFMPEPGMQDPKVNQAFPLNVRKNLREYEGKWLGRLPELQAALGMGIMLCCNFEAWYRHEKMDTYKKDNLGQTIFENYMGGWADGFLTFSKDDYNLTAFREAFTTGRIYLRLGWDKGVTAKQKAGYCQQFWEEGSLVIQINPGYLGSGLYELSDEKYLANSL